MSAKRAGKKKATGARKGKAKAPSRKPSGKPSGKPPEKPSRKVAAKKAAKTKAASPRKPAADPRPGAAPPSAGARDPARKARAPFATGRKAKKQPLPAAMAAEPRPCGRAETLPPFMPPVEPDEVLTKLVGPEPRPRTLFLRLVWIWLKSRNLLGGEEKDTIFPNKVLKRVLGERDEVPKSELREHVNAHLRSRG